MEVIHYIPAVEENKLWAKRAVEDVAAVQCLESQHQARREMPHHVLRDYRLGLQQRAAKHTGEDNYDIWDIVYERGETKKENEHPQTGTAS